MTDWKEVPWEHSEALLPDVRERGGGGGVDQRSLGADLDDGLDRANSEGQVHTGEMADFENQAFALEGVKALRRHRECVGAWRKVGEAVVAAGVCSDFLGTDERRSRDHNPGVRDHGTEGSFTVPEGRLLSPAQNGWRKQPQDYSEGEHRA